MCEEEDQAASLVKLPLKEKPGFRKSIAERLSKTTPTCLEFNYNNAELFGFTQPSLVDVIP